MPGTRATTQLSGGGVAVQLDQLLTAIGVTDWVYLTSRVSVQCTGVATAVTIQAERSTADPVGTANPAPVGSAASGNPATGMAVLTIDEAAAAWWRVRVTALTGASVAVSIGGRGAATPAAIAQDRTAAPRLARLKLSTSLATAGTNLSATISGNTAGSELRLSRNPGGRWSLAGTTLTGKGLSVGVDAPAVTEFPGTSGALAPRETEFEIQIAHDPAVPAFTRPWAGGVTPPTLATQATRSAPYNIFGSSMRFGQDASVTTNFRGVAAPAATIGLTPALAAQAATLPNDASAPVINNLAVSGYSPEAIDDAITARASSPGITGQDLSYYGGSNNGANVGSYLYDDSYRYNYVALMRTHGVAGGARNTLYVTTMTTPSMTERNRAEQYRLAYRMAKVIYELNDPSQSWGDYLTPVLEWQGDGDVPRTSGTTTADVQQQITRMAPNSLISSVSSHLFGYSYNIATKGADIPHLEAWGDGPCHFPRMPHFFEIAAAGTAGRLHFAGDLAGTTINVTTPGFSIAKVAGRPILSCTAIPAAGETLIVGTLSKGGLTRPFAIPVSISLTATTEPKWVRHQGSVVHRLDSRHALGSATQLSMFIAFAKEEDDGSNPQIAAGGSDARQHVLVADNSSNGGAARIVLYSLGMKLLNIPAIGGGIVVNGSYGTAARNIAHGRTGMFITIDTVAGVTKVWFTAGLGTTPGTATPDAGFTLGTTSTANAIDCDKLFGHLMSGSSLASDPFTGQNARQWYAKGLIDFINPAKRALFWNNTTGVVDTAGSVVDGLTPFIDIRGNAAQRQNGALYRNNPATDAGGTNCRNEGSCGDLLTLSAFPYGKMTTV